MRGTQTNKSSCLSVADEISDEMEQTSIVVENQITALCRLYRIWALILENNGKLVSWKNLAKCCLFSQFVALFHFS